MQEVYGRLTEVSSFNILQQVNNKFTRMDAVQKCATSEKSEVFAIDRGLRWKLYFFHFNLRIAFVFNCRLAFLRQ